MITFLMVTTNSLMTSINLGKKLGRRWVHLTTGAPLCSMVDGWLRNKSDAHKNMAPHEASLSAPRVRVSVSRDSGSAWLHVESTTHADSTSPSAWPHHVATDTRFRSTTSKPPQLPLPVAVAQTGNLLGVARQGHDAHAVVEALTLSLPRDAQTVRAARRRQRAPRWPCSPTFWPWSRWPSSMRGGCCRRPASSPDEQAASR